jgi:nuclear pore complex protein Nup188
MWLSKPEFESPACDTEMDEQQHSGDRDTGQRGDASKQRRVRVGSVTLAERLRRGMTGEMAADLQSLLNKAKLTLQAGSDVDLTGVLSNFLRDRVIALA